MVICNQRGLHARAAAKLVKRLNNFDAELIVSKGEIEVPGNSILGLMMLSATLGDTIKLCCSGLEKTEALQAIKELVENKFEED